MINITTIENQKRGLPHVHILVKFEKDIHLNDIDKFVSATLLNKNDLMYKFILRKMTQLHSCVYYYESQICKKRFSKPASNETYCENNGGLHP
jgi:hypothetical protein